MRRHIKFPSTPRFSKLYPTIVSDTDKSGRLAYADFDPTLGISPTEEQIEKLQNYKPDMPTLTFTGSEKLHGENMAVCYNNGELWVQGRNQIRTTLGDQNGMAAFVENHRATIIDLFESAVSRFGIYTNTHTIVIDAEWAGGNIQKGNAACSGTDKAMYLFDYFRVITDDDPTHVVYRSTNDLTTSTNDSIYKLRDFGSYTIDLDFNKPEECEAKLKELAEQVETKSPIAEYFEKPDNVGEGVYLYTTYEGELYRLKAKGEKHGGKPKTPRQPKVPLTDEQTILYTKLANDVTPVWRITQAITEIGATEMKHVGAVIGWVMKDIAKEEEVFLIANKVTPKDLNRFVAPIIRDYYFNSIKGY